MEGDESILEFKIILESLKTGLGLPANFLAILKYFEGGQMQYDRI
jgi:hypothetical protein